MKTLKYRFYYNSISCRKSAEKQKVRIIKNRDWEKYPPQTNFYQYLKHRKQGKLNNKVTNSC